MGKEEKVRSGPGVMVLGGYKSAAERLEPQAVGPIAKKKRGRYPLEERKERKEGPRTTRVKGDPARRMGAMTRLSARHGAVRCRGTRRRDEKATGWWVKRKGRKKSSIQHEREGRGDTRCGPAAKPAL